jgi:hypothetical protein
MAHCCSATIIQLLSFLLALCACLTTGAYLEDKVSELEKNFVSYFLYLIGRILILYLNVILF